MSFDPDGKSFNLKLDCPEANLAARSLPRLPLSALVFLALGVMTNLYAYYRHDTVFLVEHSNDFLHGAVTEVHACPLR
jgi:hypothetical protein